MARAFILFKIYRGGGHFVLPPHPPGSQTQKTAQAE